MRNLKRFVTRVIPPTKFVPKKDQIKKWNIVRGDKVMIISGKDKGETGTVIEVLRKINSVKISGKNMVFKHVPMTASSPTGKIQKEMPIHVTNVQLIDPSNGRPTRVAHRLVENSETKKMEHQRIAKGSKTVIPKMVDLDYQKDWKDGMFDTTPEAVKEVTFKPNLLEPVFPDGVLAELRNVHKHKYYESKRKVRQAKK